MPNPKAQFDITARDRTGSAIKSAKKKLAGLAGAFVALRVSASALNTYRQFGAAISDLSAITGATGEDLEFMRQKAKEFGASTTLSANQAAEAFKLVASAKPDLLDNARALAAVTKEAIILAEASGSTLPDAAKTLGSALNQYGAGADQAGRFINVLAAGAQKGASEIADTAMALKDSGLVAASAGTSFEELNAAIQAMSKVSLKGSEAGVGLRNVFLNLASQSEAKYKPSVVGLTQAILNLKAAQLSDIQLLEIFGKKNIVAAKSLISQSDALVQLKGQLTGTSTAYEQAATKVDNLDGDIKILGSTWESVAIMLGEVFDPVLRGVIQSLTWIGKVAQSVVIAFRDMSSSIAAYAAAATEAFSGNFKAAQRIHELRKEDRAENQRALDILWGRVEAEKALGDQQQQNKENKTTPQSTGNQEELIALAEYNKLKEEVEREHQENLKKIHQDGIRARIRFEISSLKDRAKTVFGELQSITQGVATHNKKMFQINKIAGIANAIIATHEGVTKSLKAYPWPLAGVMAAVHLAAGMAQVNAIKSASFGGSSSAPSIGGGSATPVTEVPSVGAAGTQNVSGLQEVHITIDGVLPQDPDQLDQLALSLAENLRNGGASAV